MDDVTRSDRKSRHPDIGILTARMLHHVQRTMFERLADEGFGDLRPLHGAVLAHLDEDGSRAVDLSLRSGSHKQVVSKIVDELEQLGYVTRQPDPDDRRAKLVVPTERGREQMRRSDDIADEIEEDLRALIGADRFAAVKSDLHRLLSQIGEHGRAEHPER